MFISNRINSYEGFLWQIDTIPQNLMISFIIQSRIVERKRVKRYEAWGRTCFDVKEV